MGVFSLFLLSGPQSHAGTVRKAYGDGITMLPINLRMGQSTVLRFTEKPKKVILGNSNYYSVEFIDNDLAIQPQGAVTTNLFVYGMTSKAKPNSEDEEVVFKCKKEAAPAEDDEEKMELVPLKTNE